MTREELEERARRSGRRASKVLRTGVREGWRKLKWLYNESGLFYGDRWIHVGPSEPFEIRPGETPHEALSRHRREHMGGINYGPHDDLQEQAYVRDRDGNLVPYGRVGEGPSVGAEEEEVVPIAMADEEIDAGNAGEEFHLQFDPTELEQLATRYSYPNDSDASAAGASASARGYYTADELATVCAWKTPRSKPLVAGNSAAEIEEVTRLALSDSTPERERMEALMSLRGVSVPTASALLHFADPAVYPILDYRALESLGLKGRSTYSTRFWLRYLDVCRGLAHDHGVSVRTLDKALWQHSKESGPQ